MSMVVVASMVVGSSATLALSAGVDSPAPTGENRETATNPFEYSGRYFIENRGQVADDIRFYLRGNPSIAFRDDGVMFVVLDSRQNAASLKDLGDDATKSGVRIRSSAYLLRFEGANAVRPIGTGELPFTTNFFIGNEPGNWRTGVSSFTGVVYPDLYEGIDLVYRPDSRGVKYEFVVGPGADPGVIGLTYEGVDAVRLVSAGMRVHTPLGDMTDSTPYSYQEGAGEIGCLFEAHTAFSYGFRCDAWDRSKNLVIDPLVYSTFIAGDGTDAGYGVAVSSTYRAYVTGVTYSLVFQATPGSFDTTLGGICDAFVLKMNDIGTAPFFITYLGGSDLDIGRGIALDSFGNAYVTGETSSVDFPTTSGAFITRYAQNTDAFVTKLNVSGAFLNYSGFLGGSDVDGGTAIAVDRDGNATVTGYTYSDDFPLTPAAWRKTREGKDAFVTKIYLTGEQIAYSTLVGGDQSDMGYGVALDKAGHAYVTGQTYSPNFHTTANGLNAALSGTDDAFVVGLNLGGSDLDFSTYLGGTSTECAFGIAIDSLDRVYVVGSTSSRDFLTTNGAWDRSFNGGASDVFVAKINVDPTASTLNYSTFIGGSGDDEGLSIALDSDRAAYVTGDTNSTNFPVTPGAYHTTGDFDHRDVFATKLGPGGNKLAHSTYLGGGDIDRGYSIAVDSRHDFYVTGETKSRDFPTTPGSFETIFVGVAWYTDGFLTKIPSVSLNDPPDLVITAGRIMFNPPSPVAEGTTVSIGAEVHNIGGTNATMVRVRFFDGPPGVSNRIGPDKIIPSLFYFFGLDLARVDWVAEPAGMHSICVVVDPDNQINETNENNNQACAPISVFIPPIADLVVTPANVTLSPPSPVPEGAAVRIDATVWNSGGAASTATVARFSDGLPPSARIGSDQPLGSIPSGGTVTVSVIWTALPLGIHLICAFADPDNLTVEFNKNNNLGCVDAMVESVSPTMPDYVPAGPTPPSPVRIGLLSPLRLSIKVSNQGNDTTAAHATLAFYNSSSPGSPFKTFDVPPVAVGGNSSVFTATWISPATAGACHVIADVDFGNDVTESNEANNVLDWTVNVEGGPMTGLVIGRPNYTSSETYVTSATPLEFSVVDQSKAGINFTKYRVDGANWISYSVGQPFWIQSEGEHSIEWYSEDMSRNREGINNRIISVDNTPPVTALEPSSDSFTELTQFNLTASDSGSGVMRTEYRVDNGNWTTYSAPFALPNGRHVVSYRSVDNVNNTEAEGQTWLVIGAEKLIVELEANIKPLLALVFAVVLAAVGLWSSKRRPWKGKAGSVAVLRAFALISLPFFAAEALTGIASLMTGELKVPPAIGVGSVTDVVILLLGLAVAGYWATRIPPAPPKEVIDSQG